ncbi:PEP-CTERM sorting domain-containing protein [Scytonema sp. PRP1]|uniref:PEP-CTERM sorting domain-containing protein n=1 Tax=Scytonema sp. PRP1 TaxID=3120513 RepID=UPI00300C49D2
MTKIAFSVLGAAGISLLSLTPASATILVEPVVTTVNEDLKETRTLEPEFQPGLVVEYGIPNITNNLLNATGQNIGSFVYKLETLFYSNPDSTPPFNNESVQWGDIDGDGKIGFSNVPGLVDIFKDVTVTDSVITFSGGVIPNGTVFFTQFKTQPDLTPGGGIIPPVPPPPADQDGPIRVSSFYTTVTKPTAVPEPTSALGIFLAAGALGAAVRKRKHQEKVGKKLLS